MSESIESKSYLCVHGHFYQPPRENPLTGIIPYEAGAAPYPNWNERVHAECYKPNADLGNFSNISFNIGPTLCGWLDTTHPETLNKIIAADQENMRRYSVGNALAQPYNHTILPLATYLDKVTQVAWGIADFRHRFGREPQGMWLPETAVDHETLSVIAGQGIEFTILSPSQAEMEEVDTSKPYLVELPGNQKIIVFFYNQPLSSGLSFDPSFSTNADQFTSQHLKPAYSVKAKDGNQPQLVILASDGELYGHHQPLRHLFLAHLVNGAAKSAGIVPTYPGRWLLEHYPQDKIEVEDMTSWSCAHGLLRWKGSCPCTPGDGTWKRNLRNAFDKLAKAIDDLYYQALVQFIPDPWQLRHRYIEVMLGKCQVKDLLVGLGEQPVPDTVAQQITYWLEAQYERQRMYASDGFYFEDFDRIEPRNNLEYAANAIRLVKKVSGNDLSTLILRDLHGVISERSGLRGDAVFQAYMQEAGGN